MALNDCGISLSIGITDENLFVIVEKSKGDLRKAVMSLENLFLLKLRGDSFN